MATVKKKLEKATLGGGCFWCTEAVFKRLKGVVSVVSGYSGGDRKNPSYEDVIRQDSGHAEAVQIDFDPGIISFGKILEIFWTVHDPTTLNRQGMDIGHQYRSVIFYHDEEQRIKADKSKNEASSEFTAPIVTEIVPFKNFFKAEDYHQNYYDNNTNAAYCRLVINPKLEKLVQKYAKELK